MRERVCMCVFGGGKHTEQALNGKENKAFSVKGTYVLRNQAGGHRGVWVGIGLWEWIVFCFLTRCWVHMGSCFVLIPQAVQRHTRATKHVACDEILLDQDRNQCTAASTG